ncbi:heavy-metal-associated domain-containing protein [Virgibacillus doumboii]|uniref:heavy-metal-associated domain-containing protein n=1 Tax=Virgibacillus doumboii TaxID=2697503 RepID=UPI0013DFD13F|nr:heavy metal-associated domain-containing protein [Virgibacillus doumboii]
MNEKMYLDVKGMHCPDCPAKIERVLSKMDGVSEVKVNLKTENGSVTFNNNITGTSEIINRINKMGFEAKSI